LDLTGALCALSAQQILSALISLRPQLLKMWGIISQWFPHSQVVSQEWKPIEPHLAHVPSQGHIRIEHSSLKNNLPELAPQKLPHSQVWWWLGHAHNEDCWSYPHQSCSAM